MAPAGYLMVKIFTRQKSSDHESGATLLELALASAVLIVAFVVLFGSIFAMSRVTGSSEEHALALSHITRTIEQLSDRTHDELLRFDGHLNVEPGPLRAETIEVEYFYRADAGERGGAGEGGPSPSIRPPMLDPGSVARLPNPVEVRVTVLWEDKRGRVLSRSALAAVYYH